MQIIRKRRKRKQPTFIERYGWTISIEPNCVVHDTVMIDDFTRIGTPGFGFEVVDPTVTRPIFKKPLRRKIHPYGVIINKDVEIGSHCNIDAGSHRETIIGEGTKIDSHVKIAHNVHIGRNCLIVAGSVIGGSCTIGDNCFFGINSGIRQRITIGNNVTIGMGAVVVKDVPDNAIAMGNPALLYKKYKECTKCGAYCLPYESEQCPKCGNVLQESATVKGNPAR
jgi:UDP-3-O-[3-hydroxymyristoyl] glucosamine N-acyltransferase